MSASHAALETLRMAEWTLRFHHEDALADDVYALGVALGSSTSQPCLAGPFQIEGRVTNPHDRN